MSVGTPCFGQKVESAHRLLVSGLPAPGEAIGVVQFRRAVQAETDAKALRREKAAPFFVQQDPVGLDAVQNAPAGGPVLALEFDDLPEIIHAQNGGLSSVPGEGDRRLRRGVDVLDDVLLQQAFRHAECAGLRIEAALVEVVAVAAIEIAGGSGRFGEDLKLARRPVPPLLLPAPRPRRAGPSNCFV